jgi:hypothetical protein
MARISQDQAQERQAYLLELFRQQPDISRQEAMDAYKEKFGASISPKTFNELREQAQQESGDESPTRPEPVAAAVEEDAASRLKSAALPEPGAAGQPSKKPKVKAGGPKNVFIDAPQEQLQFLERVVAQLQEAGATNLRIDYSTDRWMVLSVESK